MGYNGSTFRFVGINGYNWSSTAGYTIDRAYEYSFNAGVVEPYHNQRNEAFPLRCLSTVIDI